MNHAEAKRQVSRGHYEPGGHENENVPLVE